jgi:hypothetical protein
LCEIAHGSSQFTIRLTELFQQPRSERRFKRLMESEGGSDSGSPRGPKSDSISSMGASNGLGGGVANGKPL